jgi:hypothetical protein
LCLARRPDAGERAILDDLLASLRGSPATEEAVWQGVARAVLNLEETITRE